MVIQKHRLSYGELELTIHLFFGLSDGTLFENDSSLDVVPEYLPPDLIQGCSHLTLISHSVLYIPDAMLLGIVPSLRDVIETFQHLICEVLLIFSVQFNYQSRFLTSLFVNANQTELVLDPDINTLLASLRTLSTMDPLDDPNDVLKFS